VVLLGEDELSAGKATVRDFRDGGQVSVDRKELGSELRRRISGGEE